MLSFPTLDIPIEDDDRDIVDRLLGTPTSNESRNIRNWWG